MQRTLFVILCLFILFACQDKGVSSQKSASNELALKSAPAEVYFGEDCSEAVLKEICEAKSNISIYASSPGSTAIIGALVDARKGGLKVEAIIGNRASKAKNNPAAAMANAGIPVYIDKHAGDREETIVIDGKTVIRGGLDNRKRAAGEGMGTLTVVRSPELAAAYMESWERQRSQAKVYRTAKAAPAQKTGQKRKP